MELCRRFLEGHIHLDMVVYTLIRAPKRVYTHPYRWAWCRPHVNACEHVVEALYLVYRYNALHP